MNLNDKRLDTFARQMLTKITQRKTRQEQIDCLKQVLFTVPVRSTLAFAPELTQREIECLYYAAMGATSHETAQQLDLKASTIIAHRKEALRKLNCRNVSHAVFKGVCYGFIPPRKI